jgi:hypothetical protein
MFLWAARFEADDLNGRVLGLIRTVVPFYR